MLGTLAVGMRDDLGFGTGAQGAVSAALVVLAAAVTSIAGRLVDGRHGSWTLAMAGGLTTVSLAGAAAFARSLTVLVPFLALAGVALGAAQPATDAHLHRLVARERQGTIFSLKQAIAGPGIGLVAGLAVPATAAAGGWRGAFVAGAALAAAVAACCAFGTAPVRRRPDDVVAAPPASGRLPRRPLILLGVAGGVATAPQAAFLAFAVSTATEAGLDASIAGVCFSASCALAIAGRLLLGRRVDRGQVSILGLIAALLLVSVVGFLCFGAATPALVLVGMPLLAVTAWGWHGLFFLVAVRTSPAAPGRASGVAGTGVLMGAVAGPLLFGVGAEWSYTGSWMVAAGWSLAAAACMVLAKRAIVQAVQPGWVTIPATR